MDMIDDIFPLPIAVSSVSNLFNFFYFCTFLPRIVASAHLTTEKFMTINIYSAQICISASIFIAHFYLIYRKSLLFGTHAKMSFLVVDLLKGRGG